MINTVTIHDNYMLSELQEQHREKIKDLQRQIENLQEEIRIIQEFHNRIDDL